MGSTTLHAWSHFALPATLRIRSQFFLEEQLGQAHAPWRTKTKLRWELIDMSQHLAAIMATVPARPVDRTKSLGSFTEDDT